MDARPRKIILNFLKAIAQSNNVRTEFDGKALQNDKRIWRFRLGSYRVLSDINDKTVTNTVTTFTTKLSNHQLTNLPNITN